MKHNDHECLLDLLPFHPRIDGISKLIFGRIWSRKCGLTSRQARVPAWVLYLVVALSGVRLWEI